MSDQFSRISRMPFLHYIFSFIVFIIGINGQVSLQMAKDTTSFGNYIVLTCTIHGLQTIDIKTTRQWYRGDDDKLLCYNGRINILRKYKEKVLPGNQFSLTIFNVTDSDINVVYQCRYGFDAASKFVEADEPQTYYSDINVVYQCLYGFDAASKFIEADEPKTYLSLRLVKDSIMFGGFIILTCTVNGLNTVDRDVTRQWSMGNHDELLSYNGRINNHKKYEETVLPKNEFRLKIINVTEKDVNVTYRCRYGFDTATYFIEMNESVSLQKRVQSYHSFNTSSHIAAVQKDRGNLKFNGTISSKEKSGTKTTMILLSTLIPLAVISVLLAVVLFIAKRKKQRKETKKKNKKTDKNITEDETFLPSTEDESL